MPALTARDIAAGIGLLLVLAVMVLPPRWGLSTDAWLVAGVGLAMALWWMTEALPLPATALLPLAAFPLLGIAPLGDVAPDYAHPLIILFLGGFIIAKALARHGLHARLARRLLSLGDGSRRGTVGALMLATAFLSLWISNTASTMIMAPIGAAIAASLPDDDRLGAAVMLGIAYAATIGGMGSLIGTPPNALFAAYMAETHGVVIGFVEWAAVGLPIVAVLLPLAWLVLVRLVFPLGQGRIDTAPAAAGPFTPAERAVAIVALATAAALVLRPALEGALPGIAVTDGGIVMVGALALFALPDGQGGRLLDWQDAAAIRWDVLILFGGGLALARAIETSGLAQNIADAATVLEGASLVWLILGYAALIVLVGELASNTAMAAIFLPIAGATAAGLGLDPALMVLPVALAASIGFMLPVATPPNAIVFAHEAVTRRRMLVAGAPLDVICTVIACLMAMLLAPMVFGAG